MQKMRLCKLWPHSSALIYGKVLLVNSTNEDLLSIVAKVILGVTCTVCTLDVQLQA